MSNGTNILREASNSFLEIASMYEEIANIAEQEDTEENEDRLTMLIGKLMVITAKVQNINV
ncbi:MAG: hypothetical protein RR406_04415 [Bacilli bacterium]